MQSINISDALTIYNWPLFKLINKSHEITNKYHPENKIQKCSLLSIKTGACPEDCAYCPQSAHYNTNLENQKLTPLSEVKLAIRKAKKNGAERFCMGAAWREIPNDEQFDQILEMITYIKKEGMESCVTLGMVTENQAKKLKESGLDFYNHNLDSSREFYSKIITTRTYDDRLNTIGLISKAGISVCSGGIIGMGETIEDRCSMIVELANLDPQPQSVPINLLIPVKGTPLENSSPVEPIELVRLIALTRIMINKASIRLSAGRISLSKEAQILAFFAGANSIFLGDTLLTQDNPEINDDYKLLQELQ